MAHVGRPYDTSIQQTQYSTSANWWYRVYDDLRLVSLEKHGRRWIVDYVDW